MVANSGLGQLLGCPLRLLFDGRLISHLEPKSHLRENQDVKGDAAPGAEGGFTVGDSSRAAAAACCLGWSMDNRWKDERRQKEKENWKQENKRRIRSPATIVLGKKNPGLKRENWKSKRRAEQAVGAAGRQRERDGGRKRETGRLVEKSVGACASFKAERVGWANQDAHLLTDPSPSVHTSKLYYYAPGDTIIASEELTLHWNALPRRGSGMEESLSRSIPAFAGRS